LKILIIISIISSLLFEFNKVATSNKIKQEAAAAFKKKNYLMAIRHYHDLLTIYQLTDENIYLNMAHAYFRLQDYSTSASFYRRLLHSKKKNTRSIVNLQLGVIYAYKGKEKTAMSYLKEAMKADYKNEYARYNYELLKKKINSQKPKIKPKASLPEKDTKDEVQSDTQEPIERPRKIGGNGHKTSKGNTKPSDDTYPAGPGGKTELTGGDKEGNSKDLRSKDDGEEQAEMLKAQRFKEMNMSEAKAKMILENIKDQELLFLNHVHRNKKQKNKKDSPDW
jgi:Ca-activated chloride channel family protein